MVAIVKAETRIESSVFNEMLEEAVPGAVYDRHEEEGARTVYHLTFGFQKIHVRDLPRGRYGFTLREHNDEFIKVQNTYDTRKHVSELVQWWYPKSDAKPFFRLTYVAVGAQECELMEKFIDDYLDSCEEAEIESKGVCFKTDDPWAQKQPWYEFICNPQFMLIHKMDHTLGRFKKHWRENVHQVGKGLPSARKWSRNRKIAA